jgi:hypothetical protein
MRTVERFDQAWNQQSAVIFKQLLRSVDALPTSSWYSGANEPPLRHIIHNAYLIECYTAPVLLRLVDSHSSPWRLE